MRPLFHWKDPNNLEYAHFNRKHDIMEIVYLICSILSTTGTSFFLSLLLPFHYLLRRIAGVRATVDAGDSVALYQGTVWHERRRPVHHSFRYSVRYALIDLDTAPQSPSNHLSANDARRVAKTNGPVYLLTIPPSVGYEQNPLSLYYCYDVEGATRTLRKCIAEVTNTPWGERVTFLFNPNSDLVAKPLHVSPFMDMIGNWSMKTNEPAENLHVVISVQHPKLGNYFTASLAAKRVSSLTSGDHSGFFWLMPHKVALWIYWHQYEGWVLQQMRLGARLLHPGCLKDMIFSKGVIVSYIIISGFCRALQLWWKNVSFIQHPRYQNPAYREDALVRNENIQRCPSFGNNEADNLRIQGRACDSTANTLNNRCFTWRDATWPWS